MIQYTDDTIKLHYIQLNQNYPLEDYDSITQYTVDTIKLYYTQLKLKLSNKRYDDITYNLITLYSDGVWTEMC